MSDWLSSGINAVGSLVSNWQQNKYNKELAEQQNAFNLEMWNKQNEYNSPTETIKRLTAAGVNPRSYNNLGQFANSAEAPQAVGYSKKAPLSSFSDLAMTAAQIDNIKADTEKKEAEADAVTSNAATNRNNQITNEKRLRAETDARLKEIGIKQDATRLAIIDGMRKAWMYGDNVGGLGQFTTKFEEGFTLNKTLYNILGELQELQNKGVKLDVKGKELLNSLRELEGSLKEGEVRSFENIPREVRWWLAPIINALLR